MAEAALFSLATKLLGQLASPAFEKAYQRVQSIRKAKKDLDKLSRTIQIFQAVLLDAEKQHQESGAVREWIQRVRDVLYDADDLFDDVATDALLVENQQPQRETTLSKVRASVSNKFSAVIYDDNIAKKVKAIRKRLDEISNDMAQFQFIITPYENKKNSLGSRAETWPFVDEQVVIGRDDEKQSILEFLFDKSDFEQSASVIAIVGIGGMGKTTLAQLVFNSNEVKENFENKRWACISDIVGETNVLERIALSMGFCHGSDPKKWINSSISPSGRYLLVLDDVWDNDLSIWFGIMSLLCRGTKGSKIIVTTRFLSVAWAMKKDKCHIHELKGLSENKSWELFKRIAFTEDQENDPRWTNLGREIMQKCVNVPLAIKSIASLLLEKNTIQEWESFKDRELSKIDSIMSTLKLSYDHLPSHLKHCFAYCSMFPQDHVFHVEYLISQWIAQGYVNPNDNETLEEAGHSYFMELFRKTFFQEAMKDEFGEIEKCKMHDLIRDLAKEVAGKESVTLTIGWNQFSENTRHLYVCQGADVSRNTPQSMLDANRLRSWFFERRKSLVVEPLLTKLKLLRTLDLSYVGIENVPSSIGGLKHLRYLDLSHNKFTSLPESLTKLVNLLTLNVSWCSNFEAWPNEFRNLKNLRNLYNRDCEIPLPPGLGELTNLQHVSELKVSRKTDGSKRLAILSAGLRLKGNMTIDFDNWIDDWDEDDCWQLPTTLHSLKIRNYPGRRIPHWERGNGKIRADNISCNLLHNLVRIEIIQSSTIKHLPPFRHLPYLKLLKLMSLYELEYVEEEERDGNDEDGQSDPSTGPFFPRLESLELSYLKKLKGWSTKLERGAATVDLEEVECCSSFPLLSYLRISRCPEVTSIPLCPKLGSLALVGEDIKEELMKQLMSTSFPSLEYLSIFDRNNLESFSGETLPSLKSLELRWCHTLKNLYSMPRHLEKLKIDECRGLKLWEEDVHKRSVVWESLPELRQLETFGMGDPERLPHSLQQLQDRGQLQITCYVR